MTQPTCSHSFPSYTILKNSPAHDVVICLFDFAFAQLLVRQEKGVLCSAGAVTWVNDRLTKGVLTLCYPHWAQACLASKVQFDCSCYLLYLSPVEWTVPWPIWKKKEALRWWHKLIWTWARMKGCVFSGQEWEQLCLNMVDRDIYVNNWINQLIWC